MKLTQENSDKATLGELGNRLARHRLNRNQTQEALAEEAGVSLRTIIRIEQGESVQFTSMIRVLRALGMLGNLDVLVPEPLISPIQQVKMHGKRRQRASTQTGEPERKKPWSWGDEE